MRQVLKNAALDKHLDFIVGQTEQFTADLTASLKETTNAALAATGAASVTVQEKPSGTSATTAAAPISEGTAAMDISKDDATKDATEVPPQPTATEDSKDKKKKADDEETSSRPKRRRVEVDASAAAAEPEDQSDVRDRDFAPEMDEADDESTLKAEDEPTDAQAEVDELNEDNNLSVAELMRKYGLGDVADQVEEAEAEPTKSKSSAAERRRKRKRSATPEPSEEEEEATETMDVDNNGDGASDDGEETDLHYLAGVRKDGSPASSTLEEDAATYESCGRCSVWLTIVESSAEEVIPTGTTLQETTVATKVPYLLKATLRPYQHIGLDWLANMYDRKLNGILVRLGIVTRLSSHAIVRLTKWGWARPFRLFHCLPT